MNPRAAAVQGVLAALGLILAYTTWQREPERAPGEVLVLSATRGEVQRVHYEDGTRATDVERGAGAAEPAIWIKQSASPDGKTPARALRGNEASEKFMDGFGPFRAARALGTLGAAKLKELGFEGSKKKLEVTARGVKRSFALAGPSYGAFYLKDDQDGRVYLVTGAPIADVDSVGARLVDRRLHDFAPGEFDAVTIIVGSKRRELVQPQPPAQHAMGARLAGRQDPSKIDELASNWHDKLWRMAAVDALGRGEAPKSGTPEVALRLEYRWRGKPKGWIELGRVAAPAQAAMSTPETKAPPAGPELFGRSEHTVGWVALPASAEDVIKEAQKVVGGS
jgi:hypothetical protein